MARPCRVKVGDVYGDLTVLSLFKKNYCGKHNTTFAICQCSCGEETTVLNALLLNGKKTHCGCKRLPVKRYYKPKGSNIISESLCWYCKKVNCSWMYDFIPVEGWEATKYKYKTEKGIVDSYIVHDCPEYEYRKGGKRRPYSFLATTIPKKPKWFGDYAINICPICKHQVNFNKSKCPECGQVLDWS